MVQQVAAMMATVCIPFEDRPELTHPLVDRLLADGGFDRLLLVDNGSDQPQTARWLATVRHAPYVQVVRLPKVGPGHSLYRSWNLAAEDDVAVILNNDITVPERFVPDLLAALAAAPGDVAVVYPRAPRAPAPQGHLTRTVGLWPDGMTPFAFAGRDLPPIDERYVLYCGDGDMVRNIEAQGRTCARLETVTIRHQLGGTRKRHRGRWRDVIAEDRALLKSRWEQPCRS